MGLHYSHSGNRENLEGPAMSSYANDVLVTTDWLSDHIDDPEIRILEVDEDTTAYERGHVRNAVGINWRADLQDGLRRDFLSAESFAKLMDSLGVTPETLVIIYGGNN